MLLKNFLTMLNFNFVKNLLKYCCLLSAMVILGLSINTYFETYFFAPSPSSLDATLCVVLPFEIVDKGLLDTWYTFWNKAGEWILSLIPNYDADLVSLHNSYLIRGLLVILVYIAIVASVFVVISKNPIYSLLSLITVFFSTIIILLILNVEFLALIFLIIYIGAIAILFLFVIMMFNLKKLQAQQLAENFWCTFFVYIVIIPKSYYVIVQYINTFVVLRQSKMGLTGTAHADLLYFFKYKTNDILIFSDFLYSYYSYIFLLTGMILLTAMIGSIVLALSTLEETNRILFFKQYF